MEKNIVKKVANNNLVEAKKMVKTSLKKKLAEALDSKRKAVYKTIFRQNGQIKENSENPSYHEPYYKNKDIKVGDTVTYKNSKVKVLGINGKSVQVTDPSGDKIWAGITELN